MSKELLTVEAVIEKLKQFDPTAKVFITNAQTGQTFGFEEADVIQLPELPQCPIRTIGFKPQSYVAKIAKTETLVCINI